jgi:hypothetical protein
MRTIALLIAVALLAGCDRDPYMSRKGGYTPGEPYPARSTAYASEDEFMRNYKGIHPGELAIRR